MRVLARKEKITYEELTLHTEEAHRFIRKGDTYLCGEEPEYYKRAVLFALRGKPAPGKSVAWIGGGMCVGPRIFMLTGCSQKVYEIEPALEEFCPLGVEFIPGDWKDTLRGEYDVIVYDLGGDAPKALRQYLKPDGVILD